MKKLLLSLIFVGFLPALGMEKEPTIATSFPFDEGTVDIEYKQNLTDFTVRWKPNDSWFNKTLYPFHEEHFADNPDSIFHLENIKKVTDVTFNDDDTGCFYFHIINQDGENGRFGTDFRFKQINYDNGISYGIGFKPPVNPNLNSFQIFCLYHRVPIALFTAVSAIALASYAIYKKYGKKTEQQEPATEQEEQQKEA